MSKFTGASVQDISKVLSSDVFINVQHTVIGTVSVPYDALPLGTLLTTTDGGATWSTLKTPTYISGNTYQDGDIVYFEGNIFTNNTADNTDAPTESTWTKKGAWDANGVLYNNLTETKKASVVVTGTVKEKHLSGSDEFLKLTLFKNKIIAK
jgi:hypothetical protein